MGLNIKYKYKTHTVDSFHNFLKIFDLVGFLPWAVSFYLIVTEISENTKEIIISFNFSKAKIICSSSKYFCYFPFLSTVCPVGGLHCYLNMLSARV